MENATLLRAIEEHRDDQPVLEMLYTFYTEHNRYEGGETKAYYDELSDKLGDLSVESIDAILDIVSDLCRYHEREAFFEGVRLGVRLGHELIN